MSVLAQVDIGAALSKLIDAYGAVIFVLSLFGGGFAGGFLGFWKVSRGPLSQAVRDTTEALKASNQAVQEAQQTIREQAAALKEHRDQNAAQHETILRMQDEQDKATDRICELEKDLLAVKRTSEELSAAHTRELANLKQQLQTERKHNATLTEQIAALNGRVQSVEEENARLRVERDALRGEIDQLKAGQRRQDALPASDDAAHDPTPEAGEEASAQDVGAEGTERNGP